MATKDDEIITYETPLFDLDEMTDLCFVGDDCGRENMCGRENIVNNYLDGDYILTDLLSVELTETENSHELEFDTYKKLNRNPSESQEQCINELQNNPEKEQTLKRAKEYKCPHFECGKTFKSQITLKFHKLSHGVTSANRYTCDQCTKTFVSPQYLVYHKKNHADVFCDICNAKFNAKSALYRHMSLCHKKTVVCMYCRYKVYTEKQLAEHINKCHQLLQEAEAKIDNNNIVQKSEETAPKTNFLFGQQFKY